MPSQNAAEQGESELHILDLITTWSELQKLSLTAAEQDKAKHVYLSFKPPSQSFRN